ncbi:hypothetical protein [Rhizobium leguminosarum]|uniref:hypothetical protein n=1 Tax=Rhizobium leguminosarum TaxID=384 RepID=UPI0014428AC3|nr:hypothetical protein [Rhizobium leguminosarum]MBY5863957.1 hypothetical protein [Rhizobium leguminosarum]
MTEEKIFAEHLKMRLGDAPGAHRLEGAAVEGCPAAGGGRCSAIWHDEMHKKLETGA